MIGFADDSFASAEDPSSIESGILTLGRPIYRNGPIACMGHIIHFYSREIQRIRRPSVAAESIAVSNLVDYALWMRASIIELLHGKFAHHGVSPGDGMSLISPFEMSAEIEDPKEKVTLEAHGHEKTKLWVAPSRHRQTVLQLKECESLRLMSFCESCNATNIVSLQSIREGYGRYLGECHG